MTRVTRLLNSHRVVVLLLTGAVSASLLSASTAHAQTPGTISLVTPLALNPASPAVNQTTTATFTVQNSGGRAITRQKFRDADRESANSNVEFTGTAPVTLQPGQQYTYSASRSFPTAGTTYSACPLLWFDTTATADIAPLSLHDALPISPGTISLVTPLALTPASPAVNQSTTATFTVQNS